jgi:hypothetical protein
MNLSEIKAAIEAARKGANIKVVMERPVKLKVAYKGLPLFKRTKMTVRIGIDNAKRPSVIAAREAGDRPAEVQPLKGKTWVDFPVLSQGIANPDQYYLRMEFSSNKNEKAKPVFFIREAEIETVVEKADYEHMMLASEKRPSPSYDACFDCKIENIKQLHNAVEGEAEEAEEGEGEAENN